MKILTINCVLNVGSTGAIISNIANFKNKNDQFYFCYETGPKEVANGYLIATKMEFYVNYLLARLTGLKYGTGFSTTKRLCVYIDRVKPDVVHIHCPNINTVNIYWLLDYLKSRNVSTLITNHAEFFYTGNCSHAFECEKYKTGCGHCKVKFDPYRPYLFDRTAYEWRKMKEAFFGFKKLRLVAVSPWQAERMKSSPLISSYEPIVILNGIDTYNTFYPRDSITKRQMGIADQKKIILHVTANFSIDEDDLKGGRYIVELASKVEEAIVLIIGPSLLGEFRIKNLKNILYIGSVSDRNRLAEYYSIADLTVIASQRETFGMVCAESLSCGTPVIGFRAGGPETISLPEYSDFVEYGRTDLLADSVTRMIGLKKTKKNDIARKAQQFYSNARMAKEYYKIYNELYKM